MRWRGPVLLGGLWAAAAALAVSVGLGAVHLVAGDLNGAVASPLSSGDVVDALGTSTANAPASGRTPSGARLRAAASPPPARTGPSTPGPGPRTARPTSDSASGSAARPAASGAVGTISTAGGTVGARCVEGAPRLLYATPASGWRTTDASSTRVRFEDPHRRVTVLLGCTGTTLRATVRVQSSGGGEQPTPTPSSSDESGSDNNSSGSGSTGSGIGRSEEAG